MGLGVRFNLDGLRLPSLRSESLFVTQIEPYWYDEPLPKATGFFYQFGQTIGLVTNWHVLSGRHPSTNIPFNIDKKTPTSIRFVGNVFRKTGEIEDRAVVKFEVREFHLDLADDNGPLWWQHHGYLDEHGTSQRSDVAVLPLNRASLGLSEGEVVGCFVAQMLISGSSDPEGPSADHAYARAGSEVFILGHPQGMITQGVLPIWKRGSIASEPLMDMDGNLRIFLVDATTRHGMSGSPIICFGSRLTDSFGTPFDLGAGESETPWLLGVYAGRRGSSDDEYAMALGRAWKRPIIDEIFMHKILAGVEISGVPPY